MSLLMSPKEVEDSAATNKQVFLFSPEIIHTQRALGEEDRLDNTDSIMRRIPPHLQR